MFSEMLSVRSSWKARKNSSYYLLYLTKFSCFSRLMPLKLAGEFLTFIKRCLISITFESAEENCRQFLNIHVYPQK